MLFVSFIILKCVSENLIIKSKLYWFIDRLFPSICEEAKLTEILFAGIHLIFSPPLYPLPNNLIFSGRANFFLFWGANPPVNSSLHCKFWNITSVDCDSFCTPQSALDLKNARSVNESLILYLIRYQLICIAFAKFITLAHAEVCRIMVVHRFNQFIRYYV